MTDVPKRPALMPCIFYREPLAAIDFLERAFGFERVMIITDDQGRLAHSELQAGGGTISVGSPFIDIIATPAQTHGCNTQFLHIYLTHDIDGHCARARAAGAEILMEPEDQFYGDRTYRARDPEGHLWTFAQPVRAVTREEAEQATGLKIIGWV